MRLVERFTRLDADTVRYAVTFEDPDLWTQPWTAEILMPPTEGAMFEFACHEGNTGMTATLENRPGGGGRGERFAVVRGSRCGPFALRVTPRVT